MSAPRAKSRNAPRPVYCPIAHLHRNRAVAEDVCMGRFTHAGVTLELGAEPDWRADVHADEEWAIEWHKLYEGLELAHAFRETGERRFLTAWELLVTSFLAQVPVGTDTADVAARRVTNLVYAWSSFSATVPVPALSAAFEDELFERLQSEVGFVRDNLTPARNHRTLELYALFLAAVALPALDADGSLVAYALDELDRNLATDFLPDGVHCEASTHYHLIALRSFLAAAENARLAGIAVPGRWSENLTCACEYALHAHRPDGGLAALSDADGDAHLETLELAAALLRRDDLLYVARRGAAGMPPAECSRDFPYGGYFFQRSGWGTERPYPSERFLVFDCGRLGDGGHGHYDALSVEIAANGAALIVDPGRGTYSERGPENLRRRFKSTASHNTVTVDGLDQTPYHRGRPRGAVAHAEWLGRHVSPGLDVMCGRVTSPCYDAVHTRRVFFVDDRYWLIADVLAAATPHDYDLRFQLARDAHGRTTVEDTADAAIVRAPGLLLAIAGADSVRLEHGLVAPSYGIYVAAPLVAATTPERTTAHFVTLVAPDGAFAAEPTLRILESGATTVVDIGRDRVGWTADGRDGGWFRRAA